MRAEMTTVNMSPSLRLLLRALLLSMLLLCFLLQVRESVTKFLSGQTTVAITRETVESEPPPALSFCPGYRNGYSTGIVRDQMEQLLEHGDVTKEAVMEWWMEKTYDLSDILIKVHSPFSSPDSPRVESLVTKGNRGLEEVGVHVKESWVDYGRCYTLSFKRDLEDYSYYRLEFNMTTLPRGMTP